MAIKWYNEGHVIGFSNSNLGDAGFEFALHQYHRMTQSSGDPDPIAAEVVVERINRAEAALSLWREFFQERGSPNGPDDSFLCFFCYAANGTEHEPDCIYIRAKELFDGNS